MPLINLKNPKEIFQSAYESRYCWPKNFSGYQGNCTYIKNKEIYQGIFTVSKDFKINVVNLEEEQIVKVISSQLFEITIHRVKRNFNEIHGKNYFKEISNNSKGIEMIVSGTNEGDKYRVKDACINMVYRKIHGVIIEIFVEEFFNTGKGLLSKKYTSQQLDPITLSPKSPKYEYEDSFTNIDELWLLNSRNINFIKDNNIQTKKFLFNNLIKLP